jgi:hypothetical protein
MPQSFSASKYSFRASGVAQVIECQPNKHEALGSNPNVVKEKKKIQFSILSYLRAGLDIAKPKGKLGLVREHSNENS